MQQLLNVNTILNEIIHSTLTVNDYTQTMMQMHAQSFNEIRVICLFFFSL